MIFSPHHTLTFHKRFLMPDRTQPFVSKKNPQNLARMIAACRFRYTHNRINEANFPLTGQIAFDFDMLTVSQKDLGGQNMTTAEIEAAIDRYGYHPATLAETLAYAMERWNGKDWVVALGSSWMSPGRGRNVPFLCGDGGRRLVLRWDFPVHHWHKLCLFLVVRK
jgi:hypothetical protein